MKTHRYISFLIVIFLVFPMITAASGAPFSDVGAGHWALADINRWAAAGILNGYSNGSFRPSSPVKHSELSAILCRALALEPVQAEFPDVSSNYWASGYIGALAAAGAYRGFDGYAKPESYVTREQAALMLAKVLQLQASGTAVFADSQKISDPEYAAAAAAVQERGYITGKPGNFFDPQGNLTRAQIATILTRVARDFPLAPEGDALPGGINFPLGFRRGVNMGNMLEGPNEGDWGTKVEDRYFTMIADAGFDHVRIPVRWSAHMNGDTIESAFIERVEHVVDTALKSGLGVILNTHHFDEIFEKPAANKTKLYAIWTQVSARFKDKPDSKLVFEILNEPNGELTTEVWNPIQNECISIIRKTNPTRKIVVQSGSWGSYSTIPELILPRDQNLIVSFHYYDPHDFTHQGASWTGTVTKTGVSWNGTEQERRTVENVFKQVKSWSEATQIPVLLGEFGAYEKADMASRLRWTAFVRETAEKYGFSWDYWEFNSGFGICDPKTDRFNELLSALIPTVPNTVLATGTGAPRSQITLGNGTIGPAYFVRNVQARVPGWCGYSMSDNDDGSVTIELVKVNDWDRVYIDLPGLIAADGSLLKTTAELKIRNINNSITSISANLATGEPESETGLRHFSAMLLGSDGPYVRQNDDGSATLIFPLETAYAALKGVGGQNGVSLKLFIESSPQVSGYDRAGSLELISLELK